MQAAEPERILALIGAWMGPALQARTAAEDVWQETLWHAWRDRDAHPWRDVAAYRAWLCGIARHRVADARDRFAAARRGGDVEHARASEVGVADSATPSRIAVRAERVAAITAALEAVPPDGRELLREHLLAERPMAAVAAELGLSPATAWYRYRQALERYTAALERLL